MSLSQGHPSQTIARSISYLKTFATYNVTNQYLITCSRDDIKNYRDKEDSKLAGGCEPDHNSAIEHYFRRPSKEEKIMAMCTRVSYF